MKKRTSKKKSHKLKFKNIYKSLKKSFLLVFFFILLMKVISFTTYMQTTCTAENIIA